MRKYILLMATLTCTVTKAQVADSLKHLLALAQPDTVRIGLYVKIAEAAEDSTALWYADSAIAHGKRLLTNATGKMQAALYNYMSDAIYFKGIYFANTEAYTEAISSLNDALQFARKANNLFSEAQILNDIGVCKYYKGDIIATVDYLKRSLAIRETLNDDAQLRNAYNNIAFIYKETGLIEESLELNFKSLALAEKMKNETDISTSLNNIGQVYHQQLLDYSKGLEYYKRSLAIREKRGNKKDMGLIKNNIATLYGDMGNFAEAIRNYKESLALRREANHKYGVVQTLSNLAYNYIETGDYNNARAALAESLELNKSLQDDDLQESLHYNYAKLYDTLKMPDSALFHALASHRICLRLGNPLDISKSALMISNLYSEEHEYEQSLVFYKLYKRMQDSTLNSNLKKQGIKSELEYEYLKKKNESDKIFNEQLARKNLYTWLLVVLLIATAVIAYVLYKRRVLKQRLTEVEIRNKIASDLHDDVGSTLSSIRMYSDIVKHQPNQTPVSAELLDKISSNSKEMIETMSDIVWMIKPGNDDFNSVQGRMINFANELCIPAGINFEFTCEQTADILSMNMELRRDIYLIFKEAINNAVKYAGCHNIRVSINIEGDRLRISISDDGKGFDVANAKNGNGLSNMRKRVEIHRGKFTIKSNVNEGAEIIADLPLQ